MCVIRYTETAFGNLLKAFTYPLKTSRTFPSFFLLFIAVFFDSISQKNIFPAVIAPVEPYDKFLFIQRVSIFSIIIVIEH